MPPTTNKNSALEVDKPFKRKLRQLLDQQKPYENLNEDAE